MLEHKDEANQISKHPCHDQQIQRGWFFNAFFFFFLEMNYFLHLFKMSKWVQKEVLHSGEQPKQRATTIGKFLDICEVALFSFNCAFFICFLIYILLIYLFQHLRTLKNFNGIMEILSGLNASAVHRLKLTWNVCYHPFSSILSLFFSKAFFK